MSIQALTIDQLKLLSAINENIPPYWKTSYFTESENITINILGISESLTYPRKIASIAYSKANNCLILHFFGINTAAEVNLVKSILKNQPLMVYTV